VTTARLQRYERDGLVFDVRDAGPARGQSVVLLHGFPETSASWQSVTPGLAEAGYRVLAPDQRGYSPGARPRPRRAYRREELVADVVALADAAMLDRFHLVGHDWGAAVAWQVAMQHPGRLRSLTALSVAHPAAFRRAALTSRQGLRSWYMGFFQLPLLPEAMLRSGAWQTMRRNLRRSGLPAAFADEYVEHLRSPGALTAALNWYRGLRPLSDSRAVAVRVPTLMVWGDRDAYCDRRGVTLTERYVTASYRLEVFEGAGHWIPEEAPERLLSVLLLHLRRNRA